MESAYRETVKMVKEFWSMKMADTTVVHLKRELYMEQES